ncbi:hypothetical protein JCM8547_006543 [Rhodosporidiobolus lusitaniae]
MASSSSSRFSTATAWLETSSSTDLVTYTVPTSEPIDEQDQQPVLAQPDDHALWSSSFFPSQLNTSSFVLARVVEDAFALELRWVAFSRTAPASEDGSYSPSPSSSPFADLDAHPGTLPPVRFVFPSRLIHGAPSFALSPNGDHLEVYAVTEAGFLYVLTFPLETLFYGAELGNKDATEWSDEFRLESVEGRTAVLMEGIEDGRVAVACADGFVTLVDFAETDGTLIETELRSPHSFSIRSLVPSFSSRNLASPTKGSFAAPATSSPGQLVSLSTVSSPSSNEDLPSPSFAFGLSRDRKLKMWNLLTGSAQPPIDISKFIASTSSALALSSPSSFDSQSSRTHGGNSALLSTSPQSFLKAVLGSSSTTHLSYLALFSPPSPSSAAAFVVLGLELDPSSGELLDLRIVAERVVPPSLASLGSLVDFGVQRMDLSGAAKWTLWTVWDEGGEAELRTIGVPELDAAAAAAEEGGDESWVTVERRTAAKTAQWTASFFDEQLRDSTLSVPETFLRHISLPGRYPPATLEFALAEYEELIRSELEAAGLEDDLEAFAAEYPSPLLRAAAIVGVTVVLEQSPQTGAFLHDEYNKRLKLEWLRFVALLNESRAAGLFPTHLAVDEERGIVAVVGRDSVSVPVVREAVHTLSSLSLADVQKHQQLLLSHPEDTTSLLDLPSTPGLSPDHSFRADILPLLSAIRALEARLSPADSAVLETALLERLRTPLVEDIEDISLALFEATLEPLLSDDALRETLASVAALDSPDRAVDTFSRLLTAPQLPALESSSSELQASSELAAALLTDALATSIASRYALAKGLVALLLVVWAAEDDSALEQDVMGASDSVAGERLFARLDQTTAQALTTLHALAALQWVAAEIVTPSEEALAAVQAGLEGGEGEEDGFVSQFGGLQVGVGKKKRGGEAETSPVPAHGLLNALLRIPGYNPALLPASRVSLPVALSYVLTSLSTSLGLLPSPESPSREISASSSAVVLAFRLLQLGLPIQAAEFASLWPMTSGMKYVRGRAMLELGAGEEARMALERAASGLYAVDLDNSSDSSSSSLSIILPSSIGSSLARFYIHLVALFVPTPFDASIARFALLALEALEDEGVTDEVTEKDLWTKLFRSYAATGDYEKAYGAIISTPYHETQMTCLAHFISVVCDNGATALLTQYSFAGLEADLERNLAFRARNSDPLARPNYYKVLYAYHVSKGDYRSAGTVMYQQGRRLGELRAQGGSNFRDLATLQCQSYLAATNALSLVKKEPAWVAVVSGEEERGTKRRKITYQIPEHEFDPSVASRPLEVLELADIRKEYCIALARLQLAEEFPELERTNFHLDPEAVVALFSQTGAFDQAFSAGAVLGVDLSSLFEVVAERCVSLSLHPEGVQDATWVASSDEAATWEGSLSSKAWRLLENHLERHDTAPTYSYRLVVLERTLATNRGGKVPAFMTEYLLEHNVHALLRTLVKYDRLDEAFAFSLTAIEKSLVTAAPFSTTLPYTLFDELLAVPPGDSPHLSDDVLKQKQQELREALQKRQEKVDKAQQQLWR